MSFLYEKGLQKFLSGQINWTSDTIKVQLIRSGYYPASGVTEATLKTTHEFFNSVPDNAKIGTAQTLTGKNTTNGLASAGDVTFTNVGDTSGTIHIGAYVIYKDTGSTTTSPLIAYIDEPFKSPSTTLPTNGGSVTLTLYSSNSTLNYIFKL